MLCDTDVIACSDRNLIGENYVLKVLCKRHGTCLICLSVNRHLTSFEINSN